MDNIIFFYFFEDGGFLWVYGVYQEVYGFWWVDVFICMDIFFIAVGHGERGVRRPGWG